MTGVRTTIDIFLGNLPFSTNEKSLRQVFSKYGDIHSVSVRESNNDNNTKMAYVRYLSENDAENAVKEQNGVVVEGHSIQARRCGRRPQTNEANKQKKNRAPLMKTPFQPPKTEDSASPDLLPTNEKRTLMIQRSRDTPVEEKVMVTHVESAIIMWVQFVRDNNAAELTRIGDLLAENGQVATPLTMRPEVDKIYGCIFSEDGSWYRCIVYKNIDSYRVGIHYVDYGNKEDIEWTSLVNVPPQISTTLPFAKKIILFKMKPMGDLKKGISLVEDLTSNKLLDALNFIKLSDGSGYYAEMFVDAQSLGQLLCQNGLAISLAQQGSAGMNRPQQPSTGMNRPQQASSGMNILQKPANFKERTVAHPSPPSSVTSDSDYNLMAELNSTRRRLEGATSDRDMSRMELNSVKKKLKLSQQEHQSALEKVSETNVMQKMQNAIRLARKSRQLRLQFPTDSASTNILQEGLSVSSSPEQITMGSLKSLKSVWDALENHKRLQTMIRICKDQDELPALLTSRDEARIQLHYWLTTCIDEALKMPIEYRRRTLQKCKDQLQENYNTFLAMVCNQTTLDNPVAAYDEWKEKRIAEFSEVRRVTTLCQDRVNMCLRSLKEVFIFSLTMLWLNVRKAASSCLQRVHSCLASLQEQISLSPQDETQINKPVDLEDCFTNYLLALQREISITDLEHSREAPFFCVVVQSLQTELTKELRDLETIQRCVDDFRYLKLEVEPWLKHKPETSTLLGIRKAIRSLKSKLRHKMADIEDIEEDEAADHSEVGSIRTDMIQIRSELHAAFIKEEQQLDSLANLASVQFPELLHQYPDLSLETQKKYDGLLKASRDLDHYGVTQVPGKLGVYLSVFGDKDVFIKEYMIGDTNITKDYFLQEIIKYCSAKHDSLQKIDAVFFSKNQRQAYVQTSVAGRPLTEYIESTAPDSMEREKIVHGLSEALHALHVKNIVYGELSPDTVYVRTDGTPILKEPDFGRPLSARFQNRYASSNGLIFEAPELRLGMENYTPSADLYCLGLLVFWLQSYDTKVELRSSDGIPLLSDVTMLPELSTVVYALLTVPYDSRPQAIDVANVDIKYSTPEVAEVEQNKVAAYNAISGREVDAIGKSDPLIDLCALSSQCNLDDVSTTADSEIKAEDTQGVQEDPVMEANDLTEPDPLSDSNDDVIVEDTSKEQCEPADEILLRAASIELNDGSSVGDTSSDMPEDSEVPTSSTVSDGNRDQQIFMSNGSPSGSSPLMNVGPAGDAQITEDPNKDPSGTPAKSRMSLMSMLAAVENQSTNS